jgi:hypothetical protein
MKRHALLTFIAGMLVTALTSSAWAQLNIIDQTRSLTITTDQSFNPPVVGPTDTNTNVGSYSNSLTGGLTYPPQPGPFPIIPYVTVTASQTSIVSSSVLSDQASSSGDAEGTADHSGDSAYAIADSYYLVHFSVNSPTPFSLTGNFLRYAPETGNTDHSVLGEQVTLSETQGATTTQLYSGGFPPENNGDFPGSGGFTDTTPELLPSYNSTLLPGFTYALTADVSFQPYYMGFFSTSGHNSLNFTAVVPEPATGSASLLLGCAFLARRQSWVV